VLVHRRNEYFADSNYESGACSGPVSDHLISSHPNGEHFGREGVYQHTWPSLYGMQSSQCNNNSLAHICKYIINEIFIAKALASLSAQPQSNANTLKSVYIKTDTYKVYIMVTLGTY